MIETRFATAADLEAFYGHPWQQTIRAMVAVMDGKPIAVVGLVRNDGVNALFSDTAPEAEPFLKSVKVMRMVKNVMKFVESSRLPVVTIADNPAFVERLGFTQVDGDIYRWDRS